MKINFRQNIFSVFFCSSYYIKSSPASSRNAFLQLLLVNNICLKLWSERSGKVIYLVNLSDSSLDLIIDSHVQGTFRKLHSSLVLTTYLKKELYRYPVRLIDVYCCLWNVSWWLFLWSKSAFDKFHYIFSKVESNFEK